LRMQARLALCYCRRRRCPKATGWQAASNASRLNRCTARLPRSYLVVHEVVIPNISKHPKAVSTLSLAPMPRIAPVRIVSGSKIDHATRSPVLHLVMGKCVIFNLIIPLLKKCFMIRTPALHRMRLYIRSPEQLGTLSSLLPAQESIRVMGVTVGCQFRTFQHVV